METLRAAYAVVQSNDGAPGSDGVTFEAIEEQGVEGFLKQIRNELIEHTYWPRRARKKEIPKDGGRKVRVLSIPCIRDRVVLTLPLRNVSHNRLLGLRVRKLASHTTGSLYWRQASGFKRV